MVRRVKAKLNGDSVLAWVAYSAYTYLLEHTRPAVATSYSYVNPVIAVAIGAAMGNEKAGVEVVVAVGFIVAATVLVMWKPAPRVS